MKIKEVNIQGMHKVQNTTYDLSDCNYLCGKNGSGKSTVLQAIQLAILGYIPGYPKRNQDIVKHANSKIMSVKVVFDTEDYIEREYISTNSKVTSDLNTTIEDIDSITEDIEIPIYNFSSFLSLSPNEQKKWFLGFLPNTLDFKNDINLETLFKNKVSTLPEYDENYIDSVMLDLDGLISSMSDVHEFLKSEISLVKSRIKAQQNVLANLMYYEDVNTEYDLDTITKQIEDIKTEFYTLNKKLSVISKIEQQQSYLDACIKPTTETLDNEPVVIALKEKLNKCTNNITEIQNQVDELKEVQEDIDARYSEAKNELSKCIRPTDVGDSCPYLPNINCKNLANHKKEIANIYKESKNKLDSVEKEKDDLSTQLNPLLEKLYELESTEKSLNNELESIKSSFTAYIDAKKELDEYITNLDFEYNSSETTSDIETRIHELQDKENELYDLKSKLLANQKYKEISEENTKELALNENHLVLLETLRDYTGPNELQAELAKKPFIDLSREITKYLKKMFNNDTVECWFNLSSKSNSFEFGIKRDGLNIPFTVLSSGEQCMYMLALQSALMVSNKQEFNTILIDDAFDHLDNDNIETLVEAVLDTDIQYIIAGVANIPETDKLKDLNRIKIGG